MEENPISELARLMTPAGRGDSLLLGAVLSAPTAVAPDIPLKILVEGNTQERDSLSIDPRLLPYEIITGDSLLLLSLDNAQRYLIICRVVML